MMKSPYSRILDGEFRLLFVVPGAHERELRFRLIHTIPSPTRSYTAVSYTWGEEAEGELIYAND